MRRDLWPDENADELDAEASAFIERGEGLAAVLLAEGTGGELLGFVEIGLRTYAEGCRSSPVPYIEGWYVDPAARRAGAGRALIGAAEGWARERGHAEMASDALLENRQSELAHKALGFDEVERLIVFRKTLHRARRDRLGSGAARPPRHWRRAPRVTACRPTGRASPPARARRQPGNAAGREPSPATPPARIPARKAGARRFPDGSPTVPA